MASHAFTDLLHHFAAHGHIGEHMALPVVARSSWLHVRGDHTTTALRHFAALIRPGRGRHRRP